VEKECISRRSATPLQQGGRGSSAPQFWGFLSIYAYTLCRRTIKFDAVTHVGRCVYLGASHATPPIPLKRAEFQRSPIFGVFPYLCLHPLTQNDQIRHGNTYGEGRVSGCQPRHSVCTNASRGSSAIAEFFFRFGSSFTGPAFSAPPRRLSSHYVTDEVIRTQSGSDLNA